MKKQGFHANTKDKCDRFMKDATYLIVFDDTDYLGRGMYFWEDEKQAIWWRDTQKGGEEKAAIITAKIDKDKLLDITDIKILKELEKIYKQIKDKLAKATTIEEDNHPLGKKLDILFEYDNVFVQHFSGIYGIIRYGQRTEPDFLKGTSMTMSPRAIFLVKDRSILSDIKIWR